MQKSLALTMVGLFVALFLAQLDTSIVNTALPRIVSEMHGFELYAWVTTGYLLGSTAVVPVAGKLGDRFGRRPLLIGGVTYFLVTTLLCGLAQDMVQLVGLRTLQGVGAGILIATIFASFGQLLTPVGRARISGLITATYSSASVVGPLAGGYLTDNLSWRAIFYLHVPFGFFALWLLWRTFPRTTLGVERRLPIDYWGAVSITLATVLLLLGVGAGAVATAPLLFGAAVLFGVFLWLETRVADPILPLRLFRKNPVALSAFGSLVQSVGMFGAALFIPLFLQGVLGTSATLSGGLMTPMIVAMLITNLVVGFLLAHFGKYRVFVLLGFAASTTGFVLLATIPLEDVYARLVLSMVLLGMGTGLVISTLALAAQNAASYSDLGVVTSLVQYSRSLGSTLGSALLGAILVLNFHADVAGALPTSLADRAALAEALHWVFFSAAIVMASGFGASLFFKDVPFRRRHAEPLTTDPRPATTADADGSSHRLLREAVRAPARAAEPEWSESTAGE